MATIMMFRNVNRLRRICVATTQTMRISHYHSMHTTQSCMNRLQVRGVQCRLHQQLRIYRANIAVSSAGVSNTVRWCSGNTTLNSEELTDTAKSLLVETPALANSSSDVIGSTAQQILEPIKEVPFGELGLGGFTPVGILQNCLEFFHMGIGLPWWGAIALGTIIVRVCVFPLIIKSQRHAANMNNHMPDFQKLTEKINNARAEKDQMEVLKLSQEMQQYMKKHDVNPMKNFIPILIQAPVFISFFLALRGMAGLPVESMTQGGMFWFSDLTIADPFYALPLIASVSMLFIIRLGGEAGVSNPQADKIKKIMSFLPFVILPFTAQLPQAVFMYWITNNIMTGGQLSLLKIPSVRKAFKIPDKIKHDPAEQPKGEGFLKGIKSGWNNAVTATDALQEKEAHIKKLKQAGTGPVPQTFSYDPTTSQSTQQMASAQAQDPRRKVR